MVLRLTGLEAVTWKKEVPMKNTVTSTASFWFHLVHRGILTFPLDDDIHLLFPVRPQFTWALMLAHILHQYTISLV